MKLSRKEAALALLPGLDLSADFHTLNSETVSRLADVAKAVYYRKSANANGSTARCFFEYLARGRKTKAPDSNALVYRFGDRVALYLPGSRTIYLSVTEARQLAKALNSGVRNVKAQPKFSESEFGNVPLFIADPFNGSF